MLELTSPQNPRVKNAVRLRDRRHREREGKILIDGARELRRAVAAGVKLLELFICPTLCQTDDAKFLQTMPAVDCDVFEVSPAVFERLAFGGRTEGVLAVAAMPHPTLDSLKISDRPLIAVLEGVEKPGNIGAVLRSADAAGVSAVIVADGRTDLFNPNAIRASLGTIFTVPVCEATSEATLAWLRANAFAIYAARVDGSVPYTEANFRGPTAFILGTEATGLSTAWTGDDIRAVRLPMCGVADSLNVSITGAVLFYEALRQREPQR